MTTTPDRLGPWALAHRVRGTVRRPEQMVEATRWLFALLTFIALLLGLGGADGDQALLALAATMVLGTSVVVVYARHKVPLAWDLVDTAALLALALTSREPNVVLGFVFSSLWFRSLYGRLGRSLLRCALYAGALTASVLLWTHVPWHDAGVAMGAVVGVFPTLFLTVVVARHLAGALEGREQASRRDAVQAATGHRLLAVTDADEVRRVSWEAITGICAATPGLRVLQVEWDGPMLRVTGAVGEFDRQPETLPAAVLRAPGPVEAADQATVQRSVELDRAVGMKCAWSAVPLPDVREKRTTCWLLLGAPGQLSQEVVVSVMNVVNQASLALRNSAVHRELTVQATRDSLTGLWNRPSFNAAVSATLGHGQGASTTVLFVDLDDFKDVNDVLGHGSGDDLLREVARRLTASTRPEDLWARLGGDEFAVLLGPGALSPVDIAQRIVDAVAEPVRLGADLASVGASVGVATATHDMSLDELIHSADVAMYAAKANGKGCVQVFDPGMLQDPAGTQWSPTRVKQQRPGPVVAAGGALAQP